MGASRHDILYLLFFATAQCGTAAARFCIAAVRDACVCICVCIYVCVCVFGSAMCVQEQTQCTELSMLPTRRMMKKDESNRHS